MNNLRDERIEKFNERARRSFILLPHPLDARRHVEFIVNHAPGEEPGRYNR